MKMGTVNNNKICGTLGKHQLCIDQSFGFHLKIIKPLSAEKMFPSP